MRAGDQSYRDLSGSEEVNLLTAQALLEFGKRDSATIAPADDFTVEDEIASDRAKGREEFREFGDAVERAGIDLHLRGALVHLRTNAIELVFDKSTVW